MKIDTLVASVACLLLAFSASAGVKTYIGNDNLWDEPNNWLPSGVPSGSDRAVIPYDKDVSIINGNAVADTIEIQHRFIDEDRYVGVLRVGAGRTLTLENDTANLGGAVGADHSIIDGVLYLAHNEQNGGSTLIVSAGGLAIQPAHIFQGDGQIYGADQDCQIVIAAGKLMVSRLAEDDQGVRGGMTIVGQSGTISGSFRNEGLVEAFDDYVLGGGNIVLASSTPLSDIVGARYRVQGCGVHSIVFERESLNLKGNFWSYISSGEYDFWFVKSVRTCGAYIRIGGTHAGYPLCAGLKVEPGETFEYVTYLTCPWSSCACPNPGTAGPGPVDCDNPYVVDYSFAGDGCGDGE